MVLYGHSGQANARRLWLPLVAGRKLGIGEALFCFFMHSIRKLDRKWSSWNSNQHSYMEDSVAISCLAHCAKASPRTNFGNLQDEYKGKLHSDSSGWTNAAFACKKYQATSKAKLLRAQNYSFLVGKYGLSALTNKNRMLKLWFLNF